MPQTLVVETALASHLSPDGADRLEADLARRLDRMIRQIEHLEHHAKISNEAIALFVRFWLTSTPPLPDTAQTVAQPRAASGTKASSKRLGRGLARGRTFAVEITAEMSAATRNPGGPEKPFKNASDGAVASGLRRRGTQQRCCDAGPTRASTSAKYEHTATGASIPNHQTPHAQSVDAASQRAMLYRALGMPLPPSLQNIFEEIADDLGKPWCIASATSNDGPSRA